MDAKDLMAKRRAFTPLNPDHLSKRIDVVLVEMREDGPFVTVKGRDVAWLLY
jgi:hypothetical protein